MTGTDELMAELKDIRMSSEVAADLATNFFATETYLEFRRRLFAIMEKREANLKRGITEQKGAAIIGPAGTGKTRMAVQAAEEYARAAEASGGREFGFRIISVTVPGRASVRDTCKEILRLLGYPIKANRDEDYLVDLVVSKMEEHRVAGLHLDEVQDAGKYTTGESMRRFTKRFRNLMQSPRWPVCLILTGTMEAKELLNEDKTLSRRCSPIEIPRMRREVDGLVMSRAIREMMEKANLLDTALVDLTEFQNRLIHAADGRFGMAIELAIEAIEQARLSGGAELDVEHFAEAYYVRTNGDDELNPFIAERWKSINTQVLLDRVKSDEGTPRRRSRKQI